MSPGEILKAARIISAPRVSGDEPELAELIFEARECSPRERG